MSCSFSWTNGETCWTCRRRDGNYHVSELRVKDSTRSAQLHCSHVSPTIPTTSESHRGKINRNIPRVFGIPRIRQEFREYPHTASGKLTDRPAILVSLWYWLAITEAIGSQDRRDPRMNFAFRQGLSLTAWEREHSPVDYGSLVRIYKQWNDPAGHVRDKFMRLIAAAALAHKAHVSSSLLLYLNCPPSNIDYRRFDAPRVLRLIVISICHEF